MIQIISRLTVALLLTFSILSANNIPNPCKLVTQAEANKIMNIPMQSGRLKDGRSYFMGLTCTYFSKDRFEKPGSVEITVDSTQSMKETDSIYESAKDHYDKEKNAHIQALKDHNKADSFHKIDGIGDDAYWYNPSLTILYKDFYIVIRTHAGGGMSASSSEDLQKKVEARNLSVSKQIAQLMLSKLKSQ